MQTARTAPWVYGLCLLLSSVTAQAEVVRLEILDRTPFADGNTYGETGAYELIEGRLHYSVDPDDPANRRIVDLALAPRNEEGRVTFAGDFLLLTPQDPGRGKQRPWPDDRGGDRPGTGQEQPPVQCDMLRCD